jgi:hypothetical protein
MSGRGRASFDIQTAGNFYDMLVKPQYKLFKRSQAKSARPSELKSRHAILGIICTYHLYEWVHGGQKFVQRNFKGSPKICEMLEIARQLTNGSKHFKSSPLTRVEKSFSPGFAPGFAQEAYPALLVTKHDGTEIQVTEMLDTLMSFWEAERAAGKF